MRFAEDRRARVPFALLAVVLLVSSAVFATTLSTREPAQIDRAVDESLDRVDADARLAIRGAVSEAARSAASDPVTSAADTPAGAVLNDSRPFRDALRIRVYLRARERLAIVRHRADGVLARASLPATPEDVSLRAAKRRVEVESVANGTAVRATVRDVTLVATRENRTVASENETYTVTVDSPALALHDRAERFQRQLNRGPTEGPGLGRQLTARLYPIAWARGALQYGGAPIQNVVTNRHVALATNGGVLATQRAAFGRTDPDAGEAYARAGARAALTDVLVPTRLDAKRTAEVVIPPPNSPREQTPVDRSDRAPDVDGLERTSATAPDDELTVGVNRSADRALVAVHDDDPGIDRLLAEQYRATVRFETRVETVADVDLPPPSPPGEGWTLAASVTHRTSETRPAPATLPSVSEGHVLETYTREVVQRVTVERTWRRDGSTTQTTVTRTRVVRVGLVAVGEHAPPGQAPDVPVRPLFERGGAIDGPNLADVDGKAATLVARRGGPDALARRAAAGESPPGNVTVRAERPPELKPWVRQDLLALAARIRNISVAVDRSAIATGRANPPRRLAAVLRDRRPELLSTPDAYDGVADRARIATRAVYLDAVIADLESRAERHDRQNEELTATVEAAIPGSTPPLAQTLANRSRAVDPDRRSLGPEGSPDGSERPADASGRSLDGPPTGAVTVVPDADPVYLARSEVDSRESTASYSPLAVRNLNVFTVPYGDAVDVALDETEGAVTVDLGTAGRTLIAADHALDVEPRRPSANRTAARSRSELRASRDDLNEQVEQRIGHARERAARVLLQSDAVDQSASREAIATAEAHFDGDGRLAVAIANGSFARVVAAEAAAHGELSTAERRLLVARLRSALADVPAADSRVPASDVERTAAGVREISRAILESKAKDAAGNLTQRAAERVLGDGYRGVPAGLPVLPIPGYWVATVNVWHVQVRGAYGRFTLRARDGSPGDPAGTTYVRDGSPVTLDVDGDGAAERLGRSERIAFRTSTVVVIAVPPGARGVGDIDGNADEQSAGWPCPGPESDETQSCPESA